jgi:Domain of unknown function (DUF222)
VRVGKLVTDTATAGQADPLTGVVVVPVEPWLAPVAAGVAAGRLSPGQAEAIRSGLGTPTSSLTVEVLALVAEQLCAEAVVTDVDHLHRRARLLRDEVDETGIAEREKHRYEQRSLRLFARPDGMTQLVWVMDPETAATVVPLFDRATSPKRGGVRFVDKARQIQADRILADPRTVEQVASDTFAHLLQAGADADSSHLLGTGGAVVTALVPAPSLRNREGHGRFLGQPDPISIPTVERLACAGSTRKILYDENLNPVDVTAEQRSFSPKQVLALAVRDGGCRFTGCDRPPSEPVKLFV